MVPPIIQVSWAWGDEGPISRLFAACQRRSPKPQAQAQQQGCKNNHIDRQDKTIGRIMGIKRIKGNQNRVAVGGRNQNGQTKEWG